MKNKIPCRMLIEPVSDIEYCKRLKKAVEKTKSRCSVPSELLKIWLKYNLFITNVSANILPFEVIRKTYYLRWQIELVFKTWKSFFKIDRIKKVSGLYYTNHLLLRQFGMCPNILMRSDLLLFSVTINIPNFTIKLFKQ